MPTLKDAVILGDCLDVIPRLDADSVDAVVTDPPYHPRRFGAPGAAPARGPAFQRHNAGFMGKTWDGGDVAFQPETWAAVLRVLKPGGHLVAFGGSRTFHRLAVAIEDAGFEIRDTLSYLYGSGFPKSHDVAKAIDKAAGAERAIVRPRTYEMTDGGGYSGNLNTSKPRSESAEITAPATEDARRWQGWGTALKPSYEPIVLARKRLAEKSVAANVLAHGTGALNIDGSRIGTGDGGTRDGEASAQRRYSERGSTNFAPTPGPRGGAAEGRWPANVILDTEAAALLDEQSGERGAYAPASGPTHAGPSGRHSMAGGFAGLGDQPPSFHADSGGASRFFYTAKADAEERSVGLASRNTHPTVKPISVMAWLVTLITPPGGLVLDPFLGSGTTALACIGSGFHYLGIEREAEYVEIARQRIGLGAVVLEAAGLVAPVGAAVPTVATNDEGGTVAPAGVGVCVCSHVLPDHYGTGSWCMECGAAACIEFRADAP